MAQNQLIQMLLKAKQRENDLKTQFKQIYWDSRRKFALKMQVAQGNVDDSGRLQAV